MGSRRIGLARTKALLEGLKREIDLTSTTLKDATFVGHDRKTKSMTSAGALAAEDSGKIVTLTGTAFKVSLPPVATSAGITYDIVAGAAENYEVEEDSGDSDSLVMVSVNATNTERDGPFTTATLSAGAVGDRFSIYCTGTYWVITAFANAAVGAA